MNKDIKRNKLKRKCQSVKTVTPYCYKIKEIVEEFFEDHLARINHGDSSLFGLFEKFLKEVI